MRIDAELLASTLASLKAADEAVADRTAVGLGWVTFNATSQALQVSVAMALSRLFDEGKGVASLPRIAHGLGRPNVAGRILAESGEELPRRETAIHRVLSFRRLIRELPDRGAEVRRLMDYRDMRLAHHLIEPRPSIVQAVGDQFRVDVARLYGLVRVVAPAACEALGSTPAKLEVVELIAMEHARALWSLAVPPEG